MLSPVAPAVSIRTLGVFQVTCDGIPVPRTAWQTKKALDLLKMLTTQRWPMPRQQLTGLLWPKADPATAGNRLSLLLRTVHQVLHPQGSAGPLGSDGTGVWLDRNQITVDVDEFLTQAKAALNADRTEQQDATALLHAAVAAHTGGFLEDDASHDWALPLAKEVLGSNGRSDRPLS